MASPLTLSSTATLLVLNPSEEVAKRIESHMRNAGHPVRVVWVTDLEDLEDVLRRSPPDLVLATDAMAQAPPQDAIALCTRLAPDLPILLMGANRLAPADTVSALAAGARDLVAHSDLKHLHHLELACLRELTAHQHLRELRSVRAKLADFESRHKKLLAGTADAVAHVQEGIITHANAAFAQLLGHDEPAAIEGNPLMDLVAAEHQSRIKQFLKGFAQGKAKPDELLELALVTKDGRTLALSAHVTVSQLNEDRLLELLIRSEAAAQQAPAAVGAKAPAAQPVMVEQQAVAGQRGRLELFQTLTRIAQVQVPGHAALLFVVVDDFRTIEERIGFHDAEQAVTQLAELLRQRLGAKELLFRFGTAELALVVVRGKATEAEALAEVLRKDVAAQVFKTAAHEAHLAVTVASYPLSAQEKPTQVMDTVVREARKLSAQGGNRISVLGPTAKAAQVEIEEQRKAEQVKKALQENRLKLAYQSIASLEGSSRQHFDVLARLLDETGKEVPARDFIPAAEKFGLIVAVDRWVIGRALKVLQKRQGAREVSSLFVRLSEQTLKESDAFYKWLVEQLKPRPLQKEEMVFQVQESVLQTHIGKSRALFRALRELGAEVAIDHFGVSGNAVQLLDHLTPHFVRFHFSFTKDFNKPEVQKKMAELMEVAKQRDIRTIVAHVEDANVMARLWQMGVNYIQGYHIQEPEVVLLATDLPR
ncbi:MAG TPA: GGDEF domain-containing response regulator [Candidatus Binatia bacterium]|nr:GGDEF domain-containing response regulator [Candidatus Binatia bacterium]